MPRAWWDDVPYSDPEKPLFSMTVEAAPVFDHPCGFVRLRERHRVKSGSRKIEVAGDA